MALHMFPSRYENCRKLNITRDISRSIPLVPWNKSMAYDEKITRDIPLIPFTFESIIFQRNINDDFTINPRLPTRTYKLNFKLFIIYYHSIRSIR